MVGSWVMQSVSDPFLGWTQLHGRGFYVRQLKDMKGSIDQATLDAETLAAYGRRCGYTLGFAHSRAGDPDVILGYVGKGGAVADALWEFSEAYADQTERDYGRFIEAIHDGRLKAAELEPVAPPTPAKAPKAKPAKVKTKARASKATVKVAKAKLAKAKAAKPKASGGAKR